MASVKAHWMQTAVKKPGALRATAKKMGLVKGNDPLTKGDLADLSKRGGPATQRRVALAKTFAKFRNG